MFWVIGLVDQCIYPTEPETLKLSLKAPLRKAFGSKKTLMDDGLDHREMLVNWLVSILQPERPSKVLGSFLPANLDKFLSCPPACHHDLSPLRHPWQPTIGMKPRKESLWLYRLQCHEHGACMVLLRRELPPGLQGTFLCLQAFLQNMEGVEKREEEGRETEGGRAQPFLQSIVAAG